MNAAQVTKAHIARVRAFGYTTEKGVQMAAQFIANNEAKLAAERQKAQALTAILESICEEWGRNYNTNPIGAGQRMETLASKILEKLDKDSENA